MDLPAIVNTGRPMRPVFRRVDPPQDVVVDLGTLFQRQPFLEGRWHPNGMQMRSRVDGTLTCWGLCQEGMWWGLVTYPIQFGERQRTVTHWIPAWMLKR